MEIMDLEAGLSAARKSASQPLACTVWTCVRSYSSV